MRMGRLVPLVIAVSLALDAGMRLVPIDLFTFRAWESLIIGRGPTGPFEPNRVYANPLAYGDLSRPQRYAHLRNHHLEYFSTDRWGFRQTVPAFADRPVRWLIVGDSFGVGSGLRDADTLASQIARLSGERAYNASSYDPLPLNDIRFTSGRLGMGGGTVVYEYMERQELAAAPFAGFTTARIFTDGPPPPLRSASERYRVWKKDASIDRLNILAGWGWDFISAKLGTAGAAGPSDALPTVSAALHNGATMLFFPLDVEITKNPERRIAPDYLLWLNAEVMTLNLRLVVLLAPTKYSVYGPLVNDPAAFPPSRLPLQRLADALRAHGIIAVNPTEAMSEQAARDLPRHEYVYFLDDTHWNERGIAVAAKAVVDAAGRP